MTKRTSKWRNLIVYVVCVMVLTSAIFSIAAFTAQARLTKGTDEFQSYLEYTRAKDENGKVIEGEGAGFIISGFGYIDGTDDTKNLNFGTSSSPVLIPAFHEERGVELPVIGIAQGVFAGSNSLINVSFEQIERKVGDEDNDRRFNLLSKFVLSDSMEIDGVRYDPSFIVTAADYGTAMLSIGGYEKNGTKIPK